MGNSLPQNLLYSTRRGPQWTAHDEFALEGWYVHGPTFTVEALVRAWTVTVPEALAFWDECPSACPTLVPMETRL